MNDRPHDNDEPNGQGLPPAMGGPPVDRLAIEPPQSEEQPLPLKSIHLPVGIKLMALVSLICFVIGIVKLPMSIRVGVDYERGMAYSREGKNREAIALLAPIAEKHSGLFEVDATLAECYLAVGDAKSAALVLNQWEGKHVTSVQGERLDAIAAKFDSIIKSENQPVRGKKR